MYKAPKVSADDKGEFLAPPGKEKIDAVFDYAKSTNSDLNFGKNYKVKDLPDDVVGRVIPGGISSMVLDSSFLEEQSMPEMVLLLDTIIHEGIHRTLSILENMRLGPDHPEVYDEARRRTQELREGYEEFLRRTYP